MRELLKEALARRQKCRRFSPGRKPAAVIVPLLEREGQHSILFTKRTTLVSTHKGEISFPGGAYETGDGTLLHTAIRECREEIGLPGDRIDIIGELDDFLTSGSNYVVSPYVAIVPSYFAFKLDRHEVEEIMAVPLAALMDPRRARTETLEIDGTPVTSYVYQCENGTIWGATARILNQLLGILAGIQARSETPA